MDSSSEDIFTEIRMKYAEDLEEILECPICFELPQGSIAQCIQGHHICASCKDMLMSTGYKCPICQCGFGTSRNYAAEKLCAKFEDIKNSILNPSHASNRRVKKSAGVQTDFVCKCIADKESYNSISLDNTTELIVESKQKNPKLESINSVNNIQLIKQKNNFKMK